MGKIHVNEIRPSSGSTITIDGDLKIKNDLIVTNRSGRTGGRPIRTLINNVYTSPIITVPGNYPIGPLYNGYPSNVISIGQPSTSASLSYKVLDYSSDVVYRDRVRNFNYYGPLQPHPYYFNTYNFPTLPLALDLPFGLFWKFNSNDRIFKIKVYTNMGNFGIAPNYRPTAYVYQLSAKENFLTNTLQYIDNSGGNLLSPFLSTNPPLGTVTTDPSWPNWPGLIMPGTYNNQQLTNMPGDPGTFYWEFDFSYFGDINNNTLKYPQNVGVISPSFNVLEYVTASDNKLWTDTNIGRPVQFQTIDHWFSAYYTILIKPNSDWSTIATNLGMDLKFYYTIEYGCCAKV